MFCINALCNSQQTVGSDRQHTQFRDGKLYMKSSKDWPFTELILLVLKKKSRIQFYTTNNI